MIFKEIDKKQHRYTVEKFFELVNASKEERAWFYKATNKEAKREEKQKEKAKKYEKVKELHEQGLSIVAISKALNISRPTIYKILK